MVQLALAAAAITMTITRSSLFKPLRVVKLLRCPYCFVHWVAALLVATITVDPFDFIISLFAVVALSVPCMYIIELFMEKIDEEIHDSENGTL